MQAARLGHEPIDGTGRWTVEDPNKPVGPGDAVSLADERATLEVLASTVLGLWDVVNNLTRLHPSRRPDYRVTIFGSARIDPDNWVYAAVRDLATGTDLAFRRLRTSTLRGVPGRWELYATSLH